MSALLAVPSTPAPATISTTAQISTTTKVTPNKQVAVNTNALITQSAKQSVVASTTSSKITSQKAAVEVRRIYKAISPGRVISEVASSTSGTTSLGVYIAGQRITKEEAITTARQLGFTTGISMDVIDSRFNISEGAASSTGNGQAWFISGEDYHASISYCPRYGGNYLIDLLFEMNEETGNINIETVCHPVIFD